MTLLVGQSVMNPSHLCRSQIQVAGPSALASAPGLRPARTKFTIRLL